MERIWVIGWKREYMMISGGNNAHESHGWTRRLCATGMATGSVALIYTNAMRGRYDDNRDNLKLFLAGATEMPRNIIAHELLGIFFLPTNCTN